MNKPVYEQLAEKALYAKMSESLNLVYEVYGMAKMAHSLSAITHDEFMRLNEVLVRDGINNPKAGLK